MNKLLISLLAVGLLSTPLAATEIIQELSVPAGFTINIFASDVENARQLAVSKKGIVYVGSRKAGNVYALIDHNSDGI
ncbi:MAG: sorbosone dehydrogenase family protein, partial [Pseudoalteromonas prydzensis]